MYSVMGLVYKIQDENTSSGLRLAIRPASRDFTRSQSRLQQDSGGYGLAINTYRLTA